MSPTITRLSRLAAIAAIGLLAAACSTYGGAGYGGGAGATPTAGASTAGGPPTIGTATSATLGAYLPGPNGLTLYILTTDSANTSTCSGGCATSWPPLTVPAGQSPVAGAGVAGSLGTFTRADGSTQVTYNGLPLYSWVSDTKAGDTTGQGVGGFVVATVSGAAPSSSPGGRYGY